MDLAGGTPSDDEGVLVDSLSPRERQLLVMATDGRTDQAIAGELGISLATVSTYWGRIRIKFGPLGRTEIVARYLRALMNRANAALKANEMRLRTVLEANPVGIFLTDADGLIVYMNSAYEAIAGKDEAGIVQEGFSALLFPNSRPDAQVDRDRCAEGVGYISEHCWERSDGTVVWVRLRSEEWHLDGRLAGRVGVVEDVTVEREAHERRVEAEERYHLLFDLAPEAIVSVDDKLEIVGFNASAQKMFGYSLEEITGQPLANLIPEKFRPGHQGYIEAFGLSTTTSARPMAARTEVCGLRRNGDEFPCEASIVRQKLNGKLHYTAIVHDITDRFQTLASSDLLEAIPLAAWYMDEKGRMLVENHLLREYAGQSQSDLLGKATETLVHPEDLALYLDAMRTSGENGQSVNVRLRLSRACDGADRWHFCGLQPMPGKGWMVVCTDVHYLEVAADELRRVKAVFGTTAQPG